jgi:hypothetical protein
MRSRLPSRPRSLRSTRVLPATLALLAGACGEGLPDVPLDIANHDRCSTSVPPYVVDATASEIQCLVESYTYVTYANENETIMEEAMNVPGTPVCCEVCARKGTADDACGAMCKHDLCTRAYDDHYAAGQALGVCNLPSCGFDLTTCLEEHKLHSQHIDLAATDIFEDPWYGLRTDCDATAADPVRFDGLFRYLEGLGAIPGAGGGLANVEDVVEYCQDRSPNVTGDAPSTTTLTGDFDADSTGTGVSDASSGGGQTEPPPPRPRACQPYAEERFWVRPSNNFGTWNRESAGVSVEAGASYPVTVNGGGIAYTLLPCQGAVDAQCLRIDQLSVRLIHPYSALAVSIALLQHSELIPMSTAGHIDIPPESLRFAVRSEQDGEETLGMATNDERVPGRVDALDGHLHLTGISGSSDDGTAFATMSLHADLANTQPSTTIIQNAGARGNRVSLSALTFDAERDPIVHHWMIPKVGSWTGDDLDVELPVGRHAVILRAEDVHRSRGIAATWIVIRPSGT